MLSVPLLGKVTKKYYFFFLKYLDFRLIKLVSLILI